MESLRWGTMIGSMALAGICSQYYSLRAIGVVAGMLGCVTAVCWAWANQMGRLPWPEREEVTTQFPEPKFAVLSASSVPIFQQEALRHQPTSTPRSQAAC